MRSPLLVGGFVLVLALLGMLATPGAVGDDDTTAKSEPIRHVVMFKFKEGIAAADLAKVEQAFAALPSKIDAIKDFEWGTNDSPEGKNKGFTHLFALTFDDKAGLEAYLPHPAHKEFAGMLGPYIDDVMVIDYSPKK